MKKETLRGLVELAVTIGSSDGLLFITVQL